MFGLGKIRTKLLVWAFSSGNCRGEVSVMKFMTVACTPVLSSPTEIAKCRVLTCPVHRKTTARCTLVDAFTLSGT